MNFFWVVMKVVWGLLKFMGILNCWEFFIVMFVFCFFGGVIIVRVSRFVVMVISFFLLCTDL